MTLNSPEASRTLLGNAELEARLRREPRAALIVNTRSRRGAQLYDTALAELRAGGVELVARHPVRDPSRLADVVRGALASGLKLMIIGSGDGTLSALCGQFAYRDVVLGVLPLGTSNGFARSLGIPVDLQAAVDVVLHGTVRSVDLGQANERYYANMASLGLPAAVAGTVPPELKRVLGRLAYALTALRLSLSFAPFACDFDLDGRHETLRTRHVVIGNGRIYGGREIAPGAGVNDQLLDILVLGEAGRGQLLKAWLAFFTGRQQRSGNVTAFTARDLRLATQPPQNVDIDGEVALRTPVHFRVAPGALRVLVPRPVP